MDELRPGWFWVVVFGIGLAEWLWSTTGCSELVEVDLDLNGCTVEWVESTGWAHGDVEMGSHGSVVIVKERAR
ncbi:hypothetical protein M0R45_015605 [Rubus argutus]|uniref:Uncharacterized protein n=1 Tax=Rubus argutus TaxID=59490 RepID=A0AAW1XRC3_RUBAR